MRLMNYSIPRCALEPELELEPELSCVSNLSILWDGSATVIHTITWRSFML